jgi:transcriptional regulator with PAS, ATPase and Fis domain
VKARHIDCIVIAATNRDIEGRVKKRQFREDLFYRLNAFTIQIPALRTRPEDIFELIRYYMAQYNRAYGTQGKLMPETLARLQNYAFPGNVRELKNLIKRAVVVGESEMLDGFLKHSLDVARSSATSESYPGSQRSCLADDVKAFEKEMLRRAVRQCRTTRELASFLGVSQPTAVRKMKKFGFSFSKIHH